MATGCVETPCHNSSPRFNKMYKPYVTTLQSLLHKQADPKTKKWWEGYVKQSAPFIGVKMPVIRSVLHGWHMEYVADYLWTNGIKVIQ